MAVGLDSAAISLKNGMRNIN